MTKLLWMTIDRHPDSLKALIRDQLSDAGWEVYEVSYDSIDSMESVPLESIDAVLLAPARHFPVQYMDRLKSCKLMQIWSSGYDKFNIDDAHARGIAVANNHGSNAISVAEHTILMMLGVARRAPEMHSRVVTGSWAGNDHGMTSFSLFGKTLGVVGLGRIGTLVAIRAEAMGMKIVYTDPDESKGHPGWGRREFLSLLEEVDFLTFHVHLSAQTHEMLNQRNTHFLAKRPFIINVSRAELIERAALEHLLASGRIRGVAMDAHYEEPNSANSVLYDSENVFFSPHVAGSAVEAYENTISSCISNLRRALCGDWVDGAIETQ